MGYYSPWAIFNPKLHAVRKGGLLSKSICATQMKFFTSIYQIKDTKAISMRYVRNLSIYFKIKETLDSNVPWNFRSMWKSSGNINRKIKTQISIVCIHKHLFAVKIFCLIIKSFCAKSVKLPWHSFRHCSC